MLATCFRHYGDCKGRFGDDYDYSARDYDIDIADIGCPHIRCTLFCYESSSLSTVKGFNVPTFNYSCLRIDKLFHFFFTHDPKYVLDIGDKSSKKTTTKLFERNYTLWLIWELEIVYPKFNNWIEILFF